MDAWLPKYSKDSNGTNLIVIRKKYFDDLINWSMNGIGSKKKLNETEIYNHVMDLFRQRFKTLLSNEEFEYDVIDAVLATVIDSFRDSKLKASALSDLKRQDYFESLAIAFRRVVSILEGQTFPDPKPEQFQEPAEKALWEKFLYIGQPVEDHIGTRDYNSALARIVEIKPEVDAFFDQVMVNVDDAAVRDNRKALLFAIAGLFSKIADFSKIVVKKS